MAGRQRHPVTAAITLIWPVRSPQHHSAGTAAVRAPVSRAKPQPASARVCPSQAKGGMP
ncbi:hypothetical protein [Streptomyces sp. NBC_01614]|uniref:Uncharacterized protein n=1 Tax=Streptomyces sp. NBC_00180 TaxID=2903632 RepID=A0AAU1ICH8_9ACTN